MRDALRAMFIRAASNYSEEQLCAGWFIGLHDILRYDAENDPAWLLMALACNGWPNRDGDEDVWEPLTDAESDRALSIVFKGFTL